LVPFIQQLFFRQYYILAITAGLNINTVKPQEDESGLSLSKLVSKLEARSRKLEKTSFEFPERASIRASTTLNEK